MKAPRGQTTAVVAVLLGGLLVAAPAAAAPTVTEHWTGTVTYRATQSFTSTDLKYAPGFDTAAITWTKSYSATFTLTGELAGSQVSMTASGSGSVTDSQQAHLTSSCPEGGTASSEAVFEGSGEGSTDDAGPLEISVSPMVNGRRSFVTHPLSLSVGVPVVVNHHGIDTACDGSTSPDESSASMTYDLPAQTLYPGDDWIPPPEITGSYSPEQHTIFVEWTRDLGNGTSATYTVNLNRECSGDCCLSITSPKPNAIIAITDPVLKPQLASPQSPSQRAPNRRSITVTGTACGSGPITLNGRNAVFSGSTWTAVLPDVQPGPLRLEVSTASGQTFVQTIHIIALRVVRPAENDVLAVTAGAAMPDLDARVEVVGYPGGPPAGITFTWSLTQYSVYKIRPAAAWATPPPLTNATGTTVGVAEHWHPHYRQVVGGFARIMVKATIPGALHNPVVSDPRWLDIRGTNPGRQPVLDYISGHAGADTPVVQHLACWESGRTYQQFNPNREPREPVTKLVPTDGWDNPSVLRPRYGAPPAGIGIMQLDPAAFPAQQWNWHANLDRGITMYRSNMVQSMGARQRAQALLNSQFAAALAAVNADRAAKHLPHLGGHALAIADMTHNQHIRDAIRRYNGGTEYKYGGRYVPNLHTDTVQFVGVNSWIPVHHAVNAAYVTQVRTCAGLPALALPVPP